MGKKTHPASLRGYSTNKWFSAGGSYGRCVAEDVLIRKFVGKLENQYNLSEISIERSSNKISIVIPIQYKDADVFGLKGEKVPQIRKQLADLLKKKVDDIDVRVEQVYRFATDPKLICNKIAQSLVKGGFKSARRQVVRDAMHSGAKGILLTVSGRLGGASIARLEKYRDGSVPQQTLRSKILYTHTQAKTKSGICGVKVTICLGDN